MSAQYGGEDSRNDAAFKGRMKKGHGTTSAELELPSQSMDTLKPEPGIEGEVLYRVHW